MRFSVFWWRVTGGADGGAAGGGERHSLRESTEGVEGKYDEHE
jgi:hypothetical protein